MPELRHPERTWRLIGGPLNGEDVRGMEDAPCAMVTPSYRTVVYVVDRQRGVAHHRGRLL